jgi:hypothetical protein
MKKRFYILVFSALLLCQPLMGQLKEVTDSEGNVYRVYVPQITYPVITLPEIQKMTIQEIQALSPEVCYATVQKFTIREMNIIEPIKLVYMVSKLSAQELRTISPEKLKVMITRPSQTELLILKPETIAIVITQLQERDLDEVLKKIAPSGYWYKEQAVFYDAWKKKDVTVIAKLVKEARVEQPEFFTAWGNYQNFADINFNRSEPFRYRQVLITEIEYNWQEKFKPNDRIILTIDFGLGSREIQALQEMIKENRDKIKLVILPWGGQQVNNYDNKNISTYKEVGEWGDRLFYTVKEVAPEIPVYLTVCWVDNTMKEWMAAFKAPYDGIALWNITNTYKAPLQKIYDRLKGYNKNIILSGIFECSPDTHWIPFDVARQLTLSNYQRAKEAGFKGVILMTNTRD